MNDSNEPLDAPAAEAKPVNGDAQKRSSPSAEAPVRDAVVVVEENQASNPVSQIPASRSKRQADRITQLHPSELPRDMSMKQQPKGRYTYANGDRPLEGFTIKRGIGRGGFGEVYFAESDAGKEVALKRIERNLDVELRGVRQCLNLKHLNLVQLWDIRVDDHGESWVVMEYVPGISLADVIQKYPQGMPLELAKLWFTSAAEGVDYLHTRGIVHRDLKPGNIFYDEDQRVIKIGDYGLSKYISCSRHSGHTQTVGTVHYMAPEIGNGDYGKGIDIYALGILLYEMLTGNVPFDGETTQEIIMRHLTAEPDLDGLPEGFRKPIAKALRKDPRRRYAEVREFLEALPWKSQAASVGGGDDSPGDGHEDSSADGPRNGAPQFDGILIGDLDVELIEEEIKFGPVRDSRVRARRPDIEFIEPSVGAPGGETTSVASGLDDEPIAQFFRSGLQRAVNWWHTSEMSIPLKIGLLIVLGIAMIANSAWLLPLAMVLTVIYVAYLGVRRWVGRRDLRRTSVSRAVAGPSPVIHPLGRRELERAERERIRSLLAKLPWTLRAAELAGALIIGTVACGLFSLLSIAAFGSILDATTAMWAYFGWSVVVSLTGVASVVVASVIWQSHAGDPWLRRLTMACIGLAIGIVAWLVSVYLNIPTEMLFSSEPVAKTAGWGARSLPAMPAYPIFFALLFLVVRWWRLADPLRRTRLSVWSVLWCAIVGAIAAELVGLDPNRHAILATVIAASIQLASPWMPVFRRYQILATADTKAGGVA